MEFKFTPKMKKTTTAVVAGLIFIPCISVALTTFFGSRAQYAAYEKEFEQEVIAFELKNPHGPKQVYVDNSFTVLNDRGYVSETKSQYENKMQLVGSEGVVTCKDDLKFGNVKFENCTTRLGQYLGDLSDAETTITYTFETASLSKSDIDIVLSSGLKDGSGNIVEMSDLSKYFTLKVNTFDVNMASISLPASESETSNSWQHLILQECNLKKGTNTITLTANALNADENHGHEYVMPNIRNINIYSKEAYAKQIYFGCDTVSILEEDSYHYYTIQGRISGYEEFDLDIDMKQAGSNVDEAPIISKSAEINDSHFTLKVRLEDISCTDTTLFPHVYVQQSPWNGGGSENGDVKFVSKAGHLKEDEIQCLVGDYMIVLSSHYQMCLLEL